MVPESGGEGICVGGVVQGRMLVFLLRWPGMASGLRRVGMLSVE